MVIILALMWCSLAVARLPAREFPPFAPSPQPPTVPIPVVRTLANGLQVAILARHALPLVTLTVAIRTGAEADPPDLPGTAQFLASLLGEGTTHRSAQRVAELVDGAGGTLDTGAEWDDSYATLSVLSDHTKLAFDLLSDVVLHPKFSAQQVERVRRQTLSALDVLRHDPGYLADTVVERMVFEGTPYAHPEDGVEQSVRLITPADLAAFHARFYQPANAVLVVTGDVTTNQAMEFARRYFGGWKGKGKFSQPPVRPQPAPGGRKIVVIDDPGAVQTEIRIANPAAGRRSKEYAALSVANQILGGPAENLLFGALRRRRGLVYGASSDLVCYRSAGAWEAKTSAPTSDTIEAIRLILKEMWELRRHALGESDLGMAQNYLIGHMALEFDASDKIADRVLDLMIYNLPFDYWSHFPAEIRGLTRQEVLAATRRYLDPRRAAIVLVGNAADFQQGLSSFGSVRVIPLSRIDLAAANLEVPATPEPAQTAGQN